MHCKYDDCHRPARSQRSGICGTHYARERKGRPDAGDMPHFGRYAPKLPTAPLVRLAEGMGLDPEAVLGHSVTDEEHVSLGMADEVACKRLNVHPMTVYGDDWLKVA